MTTCRAETKSSCNEPNYFAPMLRKPGDREGHCDEEQDGERCGADDPVHQVDDLDPDTGHQAHVGQHRGQRVEDRGQDQAASGSQARDQDQSSQQVTDPLGNASDRQDHGKVPMVEVRVGLQCMIVKSKHQLSVSTPLYLFHIRREVW